MRDRSTAPSTPPDPTPAGSRGESDSLRDASIAGRTLPGGLRVLNVLGSTPDGTLYDAEYPTGLEVALLLAPPGSIETNAARRARVTRATQIQHVNVAGMYEVGELGDGSFYVVLEKVRGDPLANLLATRHRLPLAEALDLALQVAAGLRAAHRAGVVHGSLSPHTILVAGEGVGRARVKLIRFELGTALRQDGAARPVRPEAGEYASPERLAGQAPDERGDVYSLGAVLHHLLAGAPPEPGTVDRSIPRIARPVLHLALASPPTRRFPSVSEFEAALERLAVTRTRHVSGSHRTRALGVAGATLLLLAAGVMLLSRPGSPPSGDHMPAPAAAGPGTDGGAPVRPGTAARSPPPAPLASRRDTLHTRGSPPRPTRSPATPRPRPALPPVTPPGVSRGPAGPDPDQPMETGSVQTVLPRNPLLPTIEERAQVYFRVGLDEAWRQLGRPVHGIEGMSALFHGLAVGRSPPFDAARPVVRSVYLGPNESLILLDQQRILPVQRSPVLGAHNLRIGDVLLHLHGEARPEVLRGFLRRVR